MTRAAITPIPMFRDLLSFHTIERIKPIKGMTKTKPKIIVPKLMEKSNLKRRKKQALKSSSGLKEPHPAPQNPYSDIYDNRQWQSYQHCLYSIEKPE